MQADRWTLSKEPDELAQLVRILGASVNVAILRELARARRRGDGWMYLSEIADALGEAPGTVGVAIQKLMPLLEEKREKGLRYFRSTVTELRVETERPPRTPREAAPPSPPPPARRPRPRDGAR